VKVSLEKTQPLELGNTGVTFRVRDNANHHRGRFRVGKAKLEWIPHDHETGPVKTRDEIMAFFNGEE
jgi:hypothetical protein